MSFCAILEITLPTLSPALAANESLLTAVITTPLTDSEIFNIINTIIKKNNVDNGLIRLMITRGSISGSPWSYNGDAAVYALIRPFSLDPSLPVKIVYYYEI